METYIWVDENLFPEYEGGLVSFENREDAERYTLVHGGTLYKSTAIPQKELPAYEKPLLASRVIWLYNDPENINIDTELVFDEIDTPEAERTYHGIQNGVIGLAISPLPIVPSIKLTIIAVRQPNEQVYAFKKRIRQEITKKYKRLLQERPELDSWARKETLR